MLSSPPNATLRIPQAKDTVMTAAAAYPVLASMSSFPPAATFVIPTEDGCNLDCGGCVSYAREEDIPAVWSIEDYVHVARDCVVEGGAQLITIQAIEPLLPESVATTFALLNEIKRLQSEDYSVSGALITNGSYTEEYIDILSFAARNNVVIYTTIAGSTKESHDQWRRQRDQTSKRSSFDDLMTGLDLARRHVVHHAGARSTLLTEHMVATLVLLPKKTLVEEVADIPALLARFGFQTLVAQGFLKWDDVEAVETKLQPKTLQQALRSLKSACDERGIMIVVDRSDDLAIAGIDLDGFITQGNEKPFVRWLPNGQADTGEHFAYKVASDASRQWTRDADFSPGELFRTLLAG